MWSQREIKEMKRLKKLLNTIRTNINRFRYKKTITKTTGAGAELFIDIGSSSIKASIDNEYITFRASVREVTNKSELTIANNIIEVNDKWYVIGENNTSVQNVTLKCEKDNLNVLVLYAIKLLTEKIGNLDMNNVTVNTMLPFNQLSSGNKLEKVINNSYIVNDLRGNKLKINMTLNKLMVEGETSYKYFNEIHRDKCDNTIVLNIGNSTIDCITMDNVQDARQEMITINQGTNLLLSSYLKYLPQVPNSSLLGSFLKSGKFKFTKEEEKGIRQENQLYLKSIWFDIESLIKKVNMYSCNIVVTGGGAILLYEAIREVLGDRYNLILANNEESIYSDLMGLKLICNNSNDNDYMSNSDIEEVTTDDNSNYNNSHIENKSFIVNDQAEKVTSNNITGDRKSNFDLFVTLRASGYSLKQISENKLLELSYGTLKNYNSKFKKLQSI